MKNVVKISLLVASIPLVLTSCEYLKEKRSYCLETSSGFEIYEGKCYRASRNDVLESVFLINPPHNPDTSEKDREYDITWSDHLSINYFSFTDGLVGKTIISVLKLGPNIVKVNIDGNIDNQEATFGYIKVNGYAFKSLNSSTRDAYLYAYVALGNKNELPEGERDLADKPAVPVE